MNNVDIFAELAATAPDLNQSLAMASNNVRAILEGALEGKEVSRQDGEILFSARTDELAALAATADAIRRERVGEDVTFVVTRNINPTNVCYMGCRFCGFAKRREDPDAQWISLDEVAHRAQVAWTGCN
ncbi:hypothetical protein AWV80_17900 [Cupriavidus sp. UYMU48A]|nr:hypothetical protein AWV80_17900 [Cupriavidus sp. UYMU48A]